MRIKYPSQQLKKEAICIKVFSNKKNQSFKLQQNTINAIYAGKKTKRMENNWYNKFLADPEHTGTIHHPVSNFIYSFELSQKVLSAKIKITARGIYQISVNRSPVTDHKFLPGWTQYNKRLFFNEFELKTLLQDGRNDLEILLADGWYAGFLAHYGQPEDFKIAPDLSLTLEITFADHSTITITPETKGWQCANDGPIRYSDIYNGEFFDFNDQFSNYRDPILHDNDLVPIPSDALPIKNIEKRMPLSITKIDDKKYIIDFGQNITGSEVLEATIPLHQKVILRHAEVLNFDGTIYTKNLRKAKAETILIGDGSTIAYQPTFTFYGFRYIELSGLDKFDICAQVIHSEIKRVGDFSCSNILLNKLYQNILWSARDNFLDVPTDCPQRDERRGWLGDAQTFIKAALYNFDLQQFFSKWLDDVDLGCDENGAYPNIAPNIGQICAYFGQAGWADAGIICPWNLSLWYDDIRILQKHYQAMSRYVRYQEKNSDQLIYNKAQFGDWLNCDDPTSNELLGTAFFSNNAQILTKVATRLKKTEDAKQFAELAATIKKAFQKRFLNSDGELIETSQAAASLALDFNLLEQDFKIKVAKKLNESVVKNQYHLTTGFLGTPHLLYALSDNGYVHTAYRLLTQTTRPSWLYPVIMGATTVWEHWDSISEKGYADPKMNSFNHYSYGAVADWIFSVAGGLKTCESHPGFQRFIVDPKIDACLKNLNIGYQTKYGKIKIRWYQKAEKCFVVEITVPENTECLWQNNEILNPGLHKKEIMQ